MNAGDVALWAGAAGSLVTACGVWVGALHVRTARRQLEFLKDNARSAFEDDLSREYRTIVGTLPVEAFFRGETVPLSPETLRAFYRYFDLSNEQLFLGRHRRVRSETLDQWKDGIRGNLDLPSFRAAWGELVTHLPDDFFEELRPFVGGDSA